jgi:hemerythrin superfamily protein
MSSISSTPQADGINQLIDDHNTVRSLYAQFQSASTWDTKFAYAREISKNISMHAGAEEMLLYPLTRIVVKDDGKMIADHSLHEHQEIKELLYEIESLTSDQEPQLDQLMGQMYEKFQHHSQEEETDLFPRLRESVQPSTLADFDAALRVAKATGPTHPHPSAPDTPLKGLAVVGPVAGFIDRVRDMFSSAPTLKGSGRTK